MTILEFASRGDLASLEKLCDSSSTSETGLNPFFETKDIQDNNLLHIACKHGHVDVVAWVLSNETANSLINSRNLLGDTPIIIASLYGRKDVVSVLLANEECQVNIANDHGNTALHYATHRRHKPIVQLLLSNTTNRSNSMKTQILIRNKYGKTPLDRTSKEIKRDVAALAFLRDARALGKEDLCDAIVRSPEAIAMSQQQAKQRFLESVIPEIEIPFAALNPSRPFHPFETASADPLHPTTTTPTPSPKFQYMKGTWINAPILLRKLTNQTIHQSELRSLQREVESFRHLTHSSLSKTVGVCLQTPNVCIVTEFVSSRNLFAMLRDAEVEMDVEMVMKVAGEVCGGLRYLHGQNPPVYHLSLTSMNVMMTEQGAVKLTEFGFKDSVFRTWSTILDFSPDSSHASPAATLEHQHPDYNSMLPIIEYMSPELLREGCSSFSVAEFGPIDIYAFGVLFLEIITRESGYPGMSGQQIFDLVGTPEFHGPEIPDFVPDELKFILQGCFQRLPRNRSKIESIEEQLGSSAVLLQ
ncbi:hypothetical protein HDU98_010494 [Podochytrium sp. JEL0797]|nr:hypothetical protein HDU98_010494 [Podochytrium sp. JEL0797]